MFKIKNLRTVPRLLILMLDLSLVINSGLFAYFIRFNFNTKAFASYEIFPSVLMLSLHIFVWMLLTKTYAGIVRNTGIEDIQRLAGLFVGSYISYISINQFFDNLGFVSDWFMPNSVALIGVLLAFILLLAFRMLVKYFFQFMKGSKNTITKKRIVIYGAGDVGTMAYQVFENNVLSDYQPIAFIDDDNLKSGKRLFGKRIYHDLHGLKQLLDTGSISQVVIAIAEISKLKKKAILDLCAQYQVTCKLIPPPKDWVDSELSLNDVRPVKVEDLLGREEIKLSNEKIEFSIIGKVVLVTGAAGSIGSEISRQLIKYKPKLLILLDQSESPLYDLEQELKGQFESVSRKIVLCDIRDKSKLRKIFDKYRPNILFHAAAYKHVPMMEQFPEEAIETNIFGTKNLADLAVDFDLDKFVMVSTDKAVNPTNVMGASKRLAEMYVQAYGNYLEFQYVAGFTKFITTRFGNVLGSNGSVLPLFKKQLESGGPLTVTDKEITRYFMTIPEACQLVLEASIMGNGGEIFVFDMGEPVKIYDLAKSFIELSGKRLGEDIDIVFTGLRPGEKLFEELFNDYEKILPTYHKKINIAQVMPEDLISLQSHLQILEGMLFKKSKEVLVDMLSELVPGFTSSSYPRKNKLEDY
ncbi:polysaccharide biosynthesis protein [Belliella sp. R4-6]|uniref:Polysaccharide biosynthesis protein n=1 Tax=Belliella alkalica TaxID=1730871 RepID=A0ABS9V6J1_9BACT|nr:nucleoside-diphosphate sugar epimerase/dehydratase [Belliella alkalica]MCH7412037.1 polysaccharide biosynthesis protein [Belliella alkalica]